MDKEPIFDYLESLCEYVPAAFYWMDLQGKRIGLNKMCMDAIGISDKNEAIGKSALEFYRDQKIAMPLYNNVMEVIRTGSPSLCEDKIIDAIGLTRYFSATRAPLRSLDGEIVGVLGISVEITNQKKYDQLILENEIHKT